MRHGTAQALLNQVKERSCTKEALYEHIFVDLEPEATAQKEEEEEAEEAGRGEHESFSGKQHRVRVLRRVRVCRCLIPQRYGGS